jgi:hypothetical protein
MVKKIPGTLPENPRKNGKMIGELNKNNSCHHIPTGIIISDQSFGIIQNTICISGDRCFQLH